MAALSDLLAQQRANEIAAAENALVAEVNSAAGAREFAEEYLKPELTDTDAQREAQERLDVFSHWCVSKGVPSLPAKPYTIAAYIISRQGLGVAETKVRSTIEAIERAHDIAGLPNPVATFAVRFALSKYATIEPPRSWDKHGKLLFAGLPLEVQATVAAREQNREANLRRGQNEIAELKKRLMADASSTKAAEPKKVEDNAN
jgi:hypothetical protein